MKYIMLRTPSGQQLPIIFPDALVHCFVAGAMQLVIDTMDPKKDLRPKQLDRMLAEGSAKVVSAGFINLGIEVSVHGESESLGGVKSREVDAARIVIGDSVALMPDDMDEMLIALFKQMKEIV